MPWILTSKLQLACKPNSSLGGILVSMSQGLKQLRFCLPLKVCKHVDSSNLDSNPGRFVCYKFSRVYIHTSALSYIKAHVVVIMLHQKVLQRGFNDSS